MCTVQFYPGILRDKTKGNYFIYIPNDGKQNNPLGRITK